MTAWRCTESRTRGLHPPNPPTAVSSQSENKVTPLPFPPSPPPGSKMHSGSSGVEEEDDSDSLFFLAASFQRFPEKRQLSKFPPFLHHPAREHTPSYDLPGILPVRSDRRRARGEKIAKYFAEYEGSLHGKNSMLKDKKLLQNNGHMGKLSFHSTYSTAVTEI